LCLGFERAGSFRMTAKYFLIMVIKGLLVNGKQYYKNPSIKTSKSGSYTITEVSSRMKLPLGE